MKTRQGQSDTEGRGKVSLLPYFTLRNSLRRREVNGRGKVLNVPYTNVSTKNNDSRAARDKKEFLEKGGKVVCCKGDVEYDKAD